MSDIKPSHVGRLHRELGIPEGNKIPISKIMTALRSHNPARRKQAQYAKNSRGDK